MALRFDLVFSYWIFFWYIFYILHFTQYSPKFIIGLAIIENIFMLFMMIRSGSNRRTITYFIIINALIKVLPYYTLRKERIQTQDVIATIVYFILFTIWIHINHQSLTGNAKLIYNSLIQNKNNTPFLQLVNQVERNYKKMKLF